MLHEDMKENAKRLHDFHHHLKAILGLLKLLRTVKYRNMSEICYRFRIKKFIYAAVETM